MSVIGNTKTCLFLSFFPYFFLVVDLWRRPLPCRVFYVGRVVSASFVFVFVDVSDCCCCFLLVLLACRIVVVFCCFLLRYFVFVCFLLTYMIVVSLFVFKVRDCCCCFLINVLGFSCCCFSVLLTYMIVFGVESELSKASPVFLSPYRWPSFLPTSVASSLK